MTTVRVEIAAGVATLTLDRPPLNLFDPEMQADLAAALDRVEADPAARAIVVESAVPGYFVAHYDVAAILAEEGGAPRTAIGPFNALMRRLRTIPKPTIGKVGGAARGGGCELLLALDMRFGSLEGARFSFPETALGILAAGGGTQLLPALVGRARGLEMLLGGEDLDAATAERYGLLNRALPEAELDGFVAALAARVAAHPPAAVAVAKLAVEAAVPEPRGSGLALEALLLDLLKAAPETRERLRRFLAAGGQTPAGEADFAALLDAIGGAQGAAADS